MNQLHIDLDADLNEIFNHHFGQAFATPELVVLIQVNRRLKALQAKLDGQATEGDSVNPANPPPTVVAGNAEGSEV